MKIVTEQQWVQAAEELFGVDKYQARIGWAEQNKFSEQFYLYGEHDFPLSRVVLNNMTDNLPSISSDEERLAAFEVIEPKLSTASSEETEE